MFLKSIKEGVLKGIATTWMLAKVLVPVYFVVTILKYTPVLGYTSIVFEPVMKLFGLPGEAAIVLVLGNVINIYAAIGAISVLKLSAYQITTIALMISISHSMIVETAVIKQVGVKVWKVVFTRVSIACISGIFMNVIGRLT